MNINYLKRHELDLLIKEARESGDWSKVESANVSEIKDMAHVFFDITGIKDLDLSKWDTSNVEDMQEMFYNSDFNSPLKFNTSNVVIMSGMFYYSDFNQPLNFDTSNVVNMANMFRDSEYNCPLYFDTSNVEDMKGIFEHSSFNQDISDWVIKDNDKNQSVIEYRDECILKRKEREAIEASVENNKSNAFSGGLKL